MAALAPVSPRGECSVCHGSPRPGDAVRAAPCAHGPFCGACLRRWAATKPCCPLCTATIVSIHVIATGVCEPPPPPRPPSRAAGAPVSADDLAFVDHAALAAEASALLSRVESTRLSVVGRRRPSGGADAAALADVAATARGVLALARSPDAFDPVLALRCLSDLDAEVDALRSGGSGDPDRRASWGAAFASPARVGASDSGGRGFFMSEDDEDDDVHDSDRPPPHVLDLGAALEAAAARGGRARGGRRRS